MASGDTLCIFSPLGNEAPAVNYATLDLRGGHPVLDFDAVTQESAVFSALLPRSYGGGGLTVTLYWMATSATSGAVVWSTAIERMDGGTDLDADSFAAANNSGATACAATSGEPVTTNIAHTAGAQMDGLGAGEPFRLKVARVAADAGDTMTGDAELLMIEIKET